jgi:hypothetical protein
VLHIGRCGGGCDQNGVPIGDSRRLANDFARAISALTMAATSGA